MSASCWVAAARLSVPALTTPSQAAFVAADREQGQEDREEQPDAPLDQPHALNPAGGRGRGAGALVGRAVGTGVAVGVGVAARRRRRGRRRRWRGRGRRRRRGRAARGPVAAAHGAAASASRHDAAVGHQLRRAVARRRHPLCSASAASVPGRARAGSRRRRRRGSTMPSGRRRGADRARRVDSAAIARLEVGVLALERRARSRPRARCPRSAAAARPASRRSRRAARRSPRSTRGRAAGGRRRGGRAARGCARTRRCAAAARRRGTARGPGDGSGDAARACEAAAVRAACVGVRCGGHQRSSLSLRAARRRADFERGLAATSPGVGTIERRNTSSASGVRPQTQTGRSGGQMQPARAVGEEALDAPVLERVEARSRRGGRRSRSSSQASGSASSSWCELVVDGDPDRLERALGRDGRRRSAPARGSRR